MSYLRNHGLMRSPADGYPDDQSAWESLRRYAKCEKWPSLPSKEQQLAVFRLAQQVTHPDRSSGDAQSFKWVQAAGRQLALCD